MNIPVTFEGKCQLKGDFVFIFVVLVAAHRVDLNEVCLFKCCHQRLHHAHSHLQQICIQEETCSVILKNGRCDERYGQELMQLHFYTIYDIK